MEEATSRVMVASRPEVIVFNQMAVPVPEIMDECFIITTLLRCFKD
jgi:hypothetical protein